MFISNLSKEVTNEKLKEIYSTFGELVSTRIVIYKDGKSKGLAYVEFSDKVSPTFPPISIE